MVFLGDGLAGVVNACRDDAPTRLEDLLGHRLGILKVPTEA